MEAKLLELQKLLDKERAEKEKERQEKEKEKQENEKLREENERLKRELKEEKKVSSELREKVEELEKKNAELAADLEKAKTEVKRMPAKSAVCTSVLVLVPQYQIFPAIIGLFIPRADTIYLNLVHSVTFC